MIDIVVAESSGKHGQPARNEDRILVQPPFFAVIDGATAKRAYTGPSPGQLAAEAVWSSLGHLPADATAREAVDAMSAAVGQVSDGHVDGPCASAIVLSTTRDEVWVVGDGWVAVDGRVSQFGHEIERRSAAARAALLRAEMQRRPIEELLADDVGRTMLEPLSRCEGLLANLDQDDPLCFGRIDGRPVPGRFIHVLELGHWSSVVLASDGYPVLGSSYEQTERTLADRIRRDPLLIADPPATKGVALGQVSHDDRSWLELHQV